MTYFHDFLSALLSQKTPAPQSGLCSARHLLFIKLQVDATNSSAIFSSDGDPTEVSLRIQSHMVTVHHLKSNEYVALLNQRSACALQQLYQKYNIEFSAFLPSNNSTEKIHTAKKMLWIILYGFQKDVNEIGSVLAASELYLQHPFRFDQSKIYSNPHYLARPGQEDRIPTSVAISAGSESCDEVLSLHEIEKELVLQIFERAQGPDTVSFIETSSKLRTELKP